MSPPEVTFLLAVRDGGRFLKTALESALAQTFQSFSVVVVDDESTDETSAILASCKDPRLRVFRNERCMGQAASLNRGLAEIRSPYIARLDADDVCHPARLERQHGYMEAHPSVAVAGCDCAIIDRQSRRHITLHRATTPGFLKWYLCFQNPLAHPTVMIRRSAIEEVGGYATDTPHTEDYDLWTRLAARHTLINLPETLMSVRQHPNSLSARHTIEQRLVRSRLQAGWMQTLTGGALTDAEVIAWSHGKLSAEGKAGVIWKLHQACASDRSLTPEERRLIGRDAAARLLLIAPHIPDLREGFKQIWRSLSIHPLVPAAPMIWLWQRYVTRHVYNPICAFQSVVVPAENAASDL